MPGTVDHWAVLGLNPGADAAALKRAFRAQARRWHPDLNGNDPVAEERFKQVNEAYAVLSDPGRRRAWEAGEPERSGGEQQDPFASGFPDFELYLDQLFGRRRREAAQDREGQQPGRDHDGDDDGTCACTFIYNGRTLPYHRPAFFTYALLQRDAMPTS